MKSVSRHDENFPIIASRQYHETDSQMHSDEIKLDPNEKQQLSGKGLKSFEAMQDSLPSIICMGRRLWLGLGSLGVSHQRPMLDARRPTGHPWRRHGWINAFCVWAQMTLMKEPETEIFFLNSRSHILWVTKLWIELVFSLQMVSLLNASSFPLNAVCSLYNYIPFWIFAYHCWLQMVLFV